MAIYAKIDAGKTVNAVRAISGCPEGDQSLAAHPQKAPPITPSDTGMTEHAAILDTRYEEGSWKYENGTP